MGQTKLCMEVAEHEEVIEDVRLDFYSMDLKDDCTVYVEGDLLTYKGKKGKDHQTPLKYLLGLNTDVEGVVKVYSAEAPLGGGCCAAPAKKSDLVLKTSVLKSTETKEKVEAFKNCVMLNLNKF